ncbi:MAG TPA: hypothetical protein VGK72_05810, partial [Chthoniobacterales bacterium]
MAASFSAANDASVFPACHRVAGMEVAFQAIAAVAVKMMAAATLQPSGRWAKIHEKEIDENESEAGIVPAT